MTRHKLLFAPAMKEITVEEGRTILDGAREAGVFIDSQCGGRGKCGKCRVRVVEGTAGAFSAEEAEFIGAAAKDQGYRLSCKAGAAGNLTILVPEENLLSPEASKKVFSRRSTVIDPAVKAYTLEPLGGAQETQGAYFERIVSLLGSRYGLESVTIDIKVLQNLVQTIKESGEGFTILVWMNKEIIGISPGLEARRMGLAIDVGTTTVALYLCDLQDGAVVATASTTNPQILYGADVMSRISYSSHHPGEGVMRMQRELVRSLNALIEQMAARNGMRTEQIVDVTVVGNTVMHHIFLGIAPDHLGLWPFSPSIQASVDVKAREIGIAVCQSCYVHVLPVEAGFVGADNVAVLLSEEPHKQEEMCLVMDLGTNGELVLGNKERLISCSCATGPALEGAHVASGMRATKGAIERVRIDPETFEVDYKVVGMDGWAREHAAGELKPIGLCGSGIIDTVAQLFKVGLVGEDGAFKGGLVNAKRLRRGRTGTTEFVVALKEETATGDDIVFTQRDIRQIQLAKGALHGGCRILMSRFSLDAAPRMIIAGAFGMHIDKENALALGLFPWCDPENIAVVGNAAGHGAYLALVDRSRRTEADRIARDVEHIELALEEGFQKEFVRALSIPYKKDNNPP
jgi:uncharacterized 2Fe-2S/4Fe-4S cluster protein (DUF4445 family)